MGLWSDIRQERQRERRFDRLVRPQFDALYRFARSLAKDPVGAEDLLQESMVNALSRLDTLRDEGAFKVWVHRVVYRTFLDRLDRERRHLRRVEAAGEARMAAFPTPVERLEERQLGDRVAHAIALLPEDQQRAVTLVDVEGLTFAEAAEVLGVKQGTVASRVARGRAALRADLWDVARDRGVVG
jgi:RNA polymerase sigma-70 factor (ECF subfamily)